MLNGRKKSLDLVLIKKKITILGELKKKEKVHRQMYIKGESPRESGHHTKVQKNKNNK